MERLSRNVPQSGFLQSPRDEPNGCRRITTKKVVSGDRSACKNRVMVMCRGDFSSKIGFERSQYGFQLLNSLIAFSGVASLLVSVRCDERGSLNAGPSLDVGV